MGYVRKYLSADGLHRSVLHCVLQEDFPGCTKSDKSWKDCIMSGLAIFGLKFPSLLQFEKGKADPIISRNLKTMYHVEDVPSDTCLRERLDLLSPKKFRRSFKQIFSMLQRGKVLERYQYMGNYYIISLDGTGQYSSTKISCKNC